MQLPQSRILTTRCLNRVFDNTVATYKFYWLLGLLELSVRQGKTRMNIRELMVSMVADAWYPVNYFRLSFGKSDTLYRAIRELRAEFGIPMNIPIRDLRKLLQKLSDQEPRARKIMNFLQLNVPYRFLSPWIKTSDNSEMLLRSQNFENGALYKLEKAQGELWITINPAWTGYLRENCEILESFAYWGLANFLQTRNPNVPNIPGKLVRRQERSSLVRQHRFWDCAMEHGLRLSCPYTGRPLGAGKYDLDHFIPWSFVLHDLLWNLIPADPSVNSSKSDKIPVLDPYLERLATEQQAALKINISFGSLEKLMEDYTTMMFTPQEICSMDRDHLLDCFNKTISPLCLIASNMGYETWKY